jgi:hypothetical protein
MQRTPNWTECIIHFSSATAALAFVGVIAVLAVPWKILLRGVRHPQLCIECGYDLTGSMSGVCSECGNPDMQ